MAHLIRRQRSVLLGVFLATAALGGQAGAAAPWSTEGFVNPESVLWDVLQHRWIVSNLGENGPAGHEGKGFLSLLDADGKLTQLRWVEGLNAPKGMAMVGPTLYVADVDQVVVVDTVTGEIKQRHPVAEAKFLNDVAAADDGDVYVSDTLANQVFVLRHGAAPVSFIHGAELQCPNGLLVDGKHLLVAAWGTISDPATFATPTPGRLLRFARKNGKPKGAQKAVMGNLDGLVKLGKDYVLSDWLAGKVYRVRGLGAPQLLREGLDHSADLGVDPERQLLAIPEMTAGRITFVSLR